MSIISVLPQIARLNALISLLLGNLSAGDRMKIMTICTIDVHARDVVAKMIQTKVFGTRGDFCCPIFQNFGAQISCHSITLGLGTSVGGCGLGRAERRGGPPPPQHGPFAHCPCAGRWQTVPRHGCVAVPAGQGGRCHSRLLHRWRTRRHSRGNPSCGTAGMTGRGTATPTSATLSCCTPTSTWGTPPAWSSPP